MKSLRRVFVVVVALLLALACGELWARGRSASAARVAPRDHRGPAFAPQRDPRGMRLVVLGDESARSSHLPEEHTWPRLLELEFARDGVASRVEVLDLAETEGDAARTLALLRDYALDLEPNVVILSLGVLDARRPFAAPRGGLERSALWRALAGSGAWEAAAVRLRDSVTRAEFTALREQAIFDFGVRIAQLIESARARHVQVVLLRVPYGGRAASEVAQELAVGAAISGEDAAALLHTALLDELDRIGEITNTLRVDGVVFERRVERPCRWSAELCAELASSLHAAVRPRLR